MFKTFIYNEAGLKIYFIGLKNDVIKIVGVRYIKDDILGEIIYNIIY